MKDGDRATRLRSWPLLLAALFLAWAIGGPPQACAASRAIAPGGFPIYYIKSMAGTDPDGYPNTEIVVWPNENAPKQVLVRPTQHLFAFHDLFLSPDSRTLYFGAALAATEGAIYALNLKTHAVSHVVDGGLLCVLGEGEYQGDLAGC